MKITFLGANQTVTGSKYLLTFENKQQILIDCGLFQGYKQLRQRNWQAFPIPPHQLDAVILTHAHIDHSGYLPLLVKNGFSGPIYCTQGTKDLCEILLPDSAHIQEEDALKANKANYSKHKPALPLYTVQDAENALSLFHPKAYQKQYFLDKQTYFQLINSGHIIGSSFVKIQHQSSSILFTGDMGRPNDPIMQNPKLIDQIDYLVIESTYGDRLHDKEPVEITLKNIINKTYERGGTVVMPAFAVGRAQKIMYYLARLKHKNLIPNIPIYLDSPMAIKATNVLQKHLSEIRLSAKQCDEMCSIATYTQSPAESMLLDTNPDPKIIISASGMATGGRVLYHLKTYLVDAKHTILFAGYQVPGTRGERLINQEKEIKIHGELIPVKAEIQTINSLSAHADYSELLAWLKKLHLPPKKIFITHGEPDAANAFKALIENELQWHCVIPEYHHTEILK